MTAPPSALRALDDLCARVRERERLVRAHGLTGSPSSFVGAVVARLAEEVPPSARPLLVVAPDDARAAAIARDAGFFHPGEVMHLPAVETSPYAEITPDRRAIMARLATLFRLSQGGGGDILVASASALLRRVVPREELGALCDLVLPEQEVDRDALIDLARRAGYARVPVVEDPGTFAVRGGVIDLWPPLYRFPARIELLGDLVETLKSFDPQTQRTQRGLDELFVHPVRETVKTRGADPRAKLLHAADLAEHPSAKTRSILEQIEAGEDFFGVEALAPAFHARMAPIDEYLPAEARWVVLDPDGIARSVDEELGDALERYSVRRADHRLVLEPKDHYLEHGEFEAMLERAPSRVDAPALEIHETGATVPSVRLHAEPNRELAAELTRARAERAAALLRPLVTRLREARADGIRVALVCHGVTSGERLQKLLAGHDVTTDLQREPGASGLFALPPSSLPRIFLGPVKEGFQLFTDAMILVAEDEIFGPRATAREATRKSVAGVFGGDSDDFSALKPGDHVVHAVNGIGLYKGLAKLPIGGTPIDFLHLEYEGGSLYLPVWRLGEVSLYQGAEGVKPKIDRLGGLTWEKTKRKVSAEVKKLAEDLLQLYAQRKALPGHGFPPPDTMFEEFEATFPFDETPDQQKAIDDVMRDMEETRPMDRLVCGDVGYGKTEVALRAALKAVLGGKQVAVLAPTTVLVEQHLQTFRERLKGWPVSVAGLSRFSPKPEQVETLRKLGEGKVDVTIGTHRLLSNDVRFKDLGLIVVDEEQRFGVSHKEKLKRLRTQVDVLTLTATPIPRTLHMTLMGLREVSIIATPPADRLAIRTLVCRPDDDVIREGVKRELARGGQVFFVCHRIGEGKANAAETSISEWAQKLRELVPEARVAIAHGQMDPESLEKVMVEFVDGKHDVLTCTTIIESGLDIPRANTMFVSRADMFGLAQLYQLRGRIGRSRERAYCYLMVPVEGKMTHEAKQRLEVLQRFTELGAGFQIASHDLEIRGAGDLLGAEQSGHIAAVGFETYARILEEAVAELKGESIRRERDPELTVDLPGYIPDDYVPDTGQRLNLYKRLSAVNDEDELRVLLEEIVDRFGELPDEVKLLGELMVIKAYARRIGALTIDLTADRMTLAVDQDVTPLKPEKVLALINKPKSSWRLTPDMRILRTFGHNEKGDRLGAAKRSLLELSGCAN